MDVVGKMNIIVKKMVVREMLLKIVLFMVLIMKNLFVNNVQHNIMLLMMTWCVVLYYLFMIKIKKSVWLILKYMKYINIVQIGIKKNYYVLGV